MTTVPRYGASPVQKGALRPGHFQPAQQGSMGAAISDVGASLGNVAMSMGREEQAAKKAFEDAEKARTLNNETAGSMMNLAKFTNSLKEDPDSFGQWGTAHEDYTKKTLEDARKRLPADVYGSFEASYAQISTRSYIDTIGAARTVQVDKSKADLDSNLSVYNDMYATSKAEDRKLILGQAYLSISDAQNTGMISEQDAVKKRESFLKSVELTRLNNDLNQDPEATKAIFESGGYSLPEDVKPDYQKKINAAVEAERKEIITRAEKLEAQQEKFMKQAQDDLEIDFRESMINNTLTEKDILAAGQRRKLSPGQVKSLLSDLSKEDKVNSDPEEYDNTLRRVLDGQATTNQILNNPDLAPRDKKTFTSMVTTGKDNRRSEDEKSITASIRPFIISTGPLAQFVKQDEQILYQSAIEEMNERLDAGESPASIKVDLIERYNRVPISTEQLPALKFGSTDNLALAKTILVKKFQAGEITETTANREAELIEKYEGAIKNRQALEALNKNKGNRK